METNESLIRALVSQGGFALLAAFFGYLGMKGAQMWVSDVKAAGARETAWIAASAAREQALMERVLELVAATTKELASLAGTVGSLRSEVEALRSHFHSFRQALQIVQGAAEVAAGLPKSRSPLE